MSHVSDEEVIARTRNFSRYCIENRQIAWVLLVGTVIWGIYGYFGMPQRKDPDIAVRRAAAITAWPGMSAEKVEQLITRAVDARMAENAKVTRIESTSRTGISISYVDVAESVADPGKEFDDLAIKLAALQPALPQGAGPINFIKDFGDTAALMLTVASPRAGPTEIEPRAMAVEEAVRRARKGDRKRPEAGESAFTVAYAFPTTQPLRRVREAIRIFMRHMVEQGQGRDLRLVEGPGFVGVDGLSRDSDARLLAFVEEFIRENLQVSQLHPDAWDPVVIRDPADTRARLTEAAGARYGHTELDRFTELVEKTLKTLPQVAKVSRSGLLDPAIFLVYSQERLASYGLQPARLSDILGARNIMLPGGALEVSGRNLSVDPTGEFKAPAEIADVVVSVTPQGAPVYLRDVVDVLPSYQSPPRFLNYYTARDAQGRWVRQRAVTLAVEMRAGEKIGNFGKAVDATLEDLRGRLPADLILARTSDQPRQVEENIDLFMSSLYEAIILVVLVSLVGFWEWRSALLMALSIPLTLAMTFGMMHLLHVDLQQVSIASLIIALGLLVDDPVVAGDAIKRDLAAGRPPPVAAWLGPTRLATAILYATITNIVAYLPFLMLSGDTGTFLYSLPVVMTCSLVASRIVSMSFIPLLGLYVLRPHPEPSLEERRKQGFAAWYYRVGAACIRHRWKVLGGSLGVLALGAVFFLRLDQQFFPTDLNYLSYVDVWLPDDAPLVTTDELAERVERIVREEAERYGAEHGTTDTLVHLTTFVGGGGPRFWFSVSPEMEQPNYAQVLIEVKDKHDTLHLVPRLQAALVRDVAGARVDVRQLETGKAVGIPVQVRITGPDLDKLRDLAEQVKAIFRDEPLAERIRDDWGSEAFTVMLRTSPDRANLSGVSNLDVARASVFGLSGSQVTTLRDGDRLIPVIATLRMEERARLGDLRNLYVFGSNGRVPIEQVARMDLRMEETRIARRDQFRTIQVGCFPVEGVLPSVVVERVRPRLEAFARALPAGYQLAVGGEQEEQEKGFGDLLVVMAVSVVMIYIALVFQFKNAVKPFIVFAAIPYGMVGALFALWIMGAPFGFMAFLGVVSLIGVIVSHIIVLFDFIEEAHERGESFEEAVLDAGILRLRPVLITVGATVIALFPLAAHGGPLWEPMCYAQIGGLTAATFITLLLVPVIYAICVKDLRVVQWETTR